MFCCIDTWARGEQTAMVRTEVELLITRAKHQDCNIAEQIRRFVEMESQFEITRQVEDDSLSETLLYGPKIVVFAPRTNGK